MIKCDIQLMLREEIEVKGSVEEVFAELTTLIAGIMSKLSEDEQKQFEKNMRDESTWFVIKNNKTFGDDENGSEEDKLEAIMKLGKDMGLL